MDTERDTPRAIPRRDLARRAARRIGPPSAAEPHPQHRRRRRRAASGAASRARTTAAARGAARRAAARLGRRRARLAAAVARRAAVAVARAAGQGDGRPSRGQGRAQQEAAASSPAEDRRRLHRRHVRAARRLHRRRLRQHRGAEPRLDQNTQTTVVYYPDGTTEMARLGDENRTNVALDDISEAARNAVLAAENRSFYSDPGISFTGIVRAAWNNVTGGSTQGGSTITQQYVKNAYPDARTRRSPQVPGALPGDQAGQQLLEGRDPRELPEHHLLRPRRLRHRVGGRHLLRRPRLRAHRRAGRGARRPHPEPLALRPRGELRGRAGPLGARARRAWSRRAGWTPTERAAMTYPEVQPKSGSVAGHPDRSRGPHRPAGARRAARAWATAISSSRPAVCGSPRRSTALRRHRRADASTTSWPSEPENLREALVAIDPQHRRRPRLLRRRRRAPGTDYAQAQRQPGSSMKPYVLAAALEQGIGVDARRDGSSPQTFPDREAPVRNSGGASCPACTLRDAMTQSLNTTFYGLAYEVGPENVAETARAVAGLPEQLAERLPRGQDDADQPRDRHDRLGDRHRRVRDAPDRPGARLRHVRRRRRRARPVLRRARSPTPRATCCSSKAASDGRAGHLRGRRERRHLRADRRGRLLRAAVWTTAARSRARPVRRAWTT